MTIGIRGMGLIGGSFEKAFRNAGHSVLNLKTASAADIRSCELVVVCLPPLLVAPWIREHADDFADGALGSTWRRQPDGSMWEVIPWQARSAVATQMPPLIFSGEPR